MKKTIVLIILLCFPILSCTNQPTEKTTDENPFFSEYDTPFQVPPFAQIKEVHFLPAFHEGIKQQQAEIEAISNNSEAPTFENTVAALDYSGGLLRNVSSVFDNLTDAHTNDELQRIDKEVSPLLSKNSDDILLNAPLFTRIKAVYEQKESFDLSPEQDMLLEKTYKGFVRGGANLSEESKGRLREINQELSMLSLNFDENILKETNAFELVIENKDDLAGLSESSIIGAEEAAEERGYEGKWVFTLHKPSMIPFLQYSEKRELREKIFKAFTSMGNNNNELDNKANAAKIVALRLEKAKLLGYESHADYVLEDNMAKNSENVYNLLKQLWKPTLAVAKKEAKDLQAVIEKEGKNIKLEAWDWWYYAEKLRKEKYDLDENELRPYFKLKNVREGAFAVANKLFGLTFDEISDIPKYHEDVKAFEVKEADGTHVGVLYVDYFPRASKSGGAWMNAYRKQQEIDGKDIRPVIVNVGNFSKPVGDKPALLSFEEVKTLFHEFGHALHGLLSACTYPRLSGTSVPRDFVELPSQIMENWATDPEGLKAYACHYETGEPIPQSLIDKITKSSHFNQGWDFLEKLASSILDMDWFTLTEVPEIDVEKFETEAMGRVGLISEIVPRWKSTYFRHIFSGGYAAGYYSYTWCQVLDADAFEAFKETSLYDQKIAQAFRKNILEKGGTGDPMTMYTSFRGAEPKIEPLLKRKGLL